MDGASEIGGGKRDEGLLRQTQVNFNPQKTTTVTCRHLTNKTR